MANEWRTVKLGDLTDNFDSIRIPVKETDRKAGPYPYYGASGIVDHVDKFLFDGEYLLVAEDGENLRSRKTPIAFMATGKFWVNNHAHIVRGNSHADTRFLMYALTGAEVSGYLTGSTMPKLTQANLSRILILAPPLPDQRAIAHILGTLDDKIECNRRLNRTLEGIVRALFKSWFIDFDPVIDNALAAGNPIPDELADRAALRKQAAEEHANPLPDDLRALFPAEVIPTDEMGPACAGTAGRWIPKGWEVASLCSIATNPRRTVQPADLAPETPYIGLEHMPRRSISLDAWSQAADVASGKSRFHQGEILFGKLRPYFHKVGLAPVSGVCSTDILVVVPKLDCWHAFVLALVSSKAFVDYTDQCSAGTKMPRTNWTDMGRYGVAMPPKSLAETFQQHTAKTLRRIAFAVLQNAKLSALRDALLPKLLSGEVTVPVAATLTAEADR